ncbi:MAG: GNAT family N-acetyltransferase, partial [Planctomycetes bacterium]|nr:GNAT family N-acetyltransferase [Planctomycetota bacterium]
MSRQTASPTDLESLLRLHDAAFGRANRESRLVGALALGHPAFREDLHVSVADEATGEPLAAALVLPRRIELRGAPLSVGVLAPWGVSPAHREQGFGKRVIELAAERSRELGLAALVTIGDPDYLGPLGFGSAFDLHSVHATAERLPAESAADEWRGLVGEDLPRLVALYDRARSGVSGTEHRDACVPDWEAHAAESYALVHAPEGRVLAYVRFRVREELEVSECATADARG